MRSHQADGLDSSAVGRDVGWRSEDGGKRALIHTELDCPASFPCCGHVQQSAFLLHILVGQTAIAGSFRSLPPSRRLDRVIPSVAAAKSRPTTAEVFPGAMQSGDSDSHVSGG